jgi:hypothetical protein
MGDPASYAPMMEQAGPARHARRRRLAIAAGLALLPVGATTVAYVKIRPAQTTRNFPGVSIASAPAYKDAALLERAWQLPVARQFSGHVVWQTNPTSCGPSSLANVERSFGNDRTEASILGGSGKCWFGYCLGGLTLDELADLARSSTHRQVTTIHDISYDDFREQLRRSNDPRQRLVINFARGVLFGKGPGHHSPIGGFLEDANLVFVLDVNGKYGPFLVDARRLNDAMNTIDPSAGGQKRGLLVIQ